MKLLFSTLTPSNSTKMADNEEVMDLEDRESDNEVEDDDHNTEQAVTIRTSAPVVEEEGVILSGNKVTIIAKECPQLPKEQWKEADEEEYDIDVFINEQKFEIPVEYVDMLSVIKNQRTDIPDITEYPAFPMFLEFIPQTIQVIEIIGKNWTWPEIYCDDDTSGWDDVKIKARNTIQSQIDILYKNIVGEKEMFKADNLFRNFEALGFDQGQHAHAKYATTNFVIGKSVEEIRNGLGIINDFTPEEEAKLREENKWIFEEGNDGN